MIDDGSLYSWDLTSLSNKRENLKLLHNGDNSFQGNITSVEITCSDLLLLGLSNGLIVAYSVFESPHLQKCFQYHGHPIHSISCCVRGDENIDKNKYFYSICEDGLICCWNVNESTPYCTASLKEKISWSYSYSKRNMERYVMKCVFQGKIIVACGCLEKLLVVQVPNNESIFISSEIPVLHRNPITSLLIVENQSRLWMISTALDGCIALWDAYSACFHNWIWKGSNGFPLSFTLSNDLEYPLVIGYSNGTIGFIDSRSTFNIRKLPNIQTTKRLSFLHREESLSDICYVPYSPNFSPNFLAMVTTQGLLVFGRIQFSSPKDNENEDPLQEKFCFQKICSICVDGKKRKCTSNKFHLRWITAYDKDDEINSSEENILHLLKTNELLVIETDHSGHVLEGSLWYLSWNNTAQELEWRFRVCLSQEWKKLSIQKQYLSTAMTVHSISCSADGCLVAVACNFQFCFIWNVNTLDLVFCAELAKLHLISFHQWKRISQREDNILTENNPLAFCTTDGRVGLLRFQQNADYVGQPLDIIWCGISLQKPIVSLYAIESFSIQITIALSDGSIQVSHSWTHWMDG